MTMPGMADLQYDVASAVSLGQRDCQEDAIICDFPLGSDLGFAVLADGMGGHAAGDVASKIVVTEVFAELKLQSGDPQSLEKDISQVLLGAAEAANDCVRAQAESEPGTEGMGATLVVPVLMQNRLYWISVGDSPLFLFRDGTLSQLNEDHSMAPQIDYLASTGSIEAETAINHPDRNCLTSVLAGHPIPRIDCPTTPLQLKAGDIVIAASDGLQFLGNDEIAGILAEHGACTSAAISRELMHNLDELGDPDQDNISFCIIRVCKAAKRAGLVQMVPALDQQTAMPVAGTQNEKITIMASKNGSSLSMMYRMSSGRGA